MLELRSDMFSVYLLWPELCFTPTSGDVLVVWYSWLYKYLCNQCLSPLTLWVRTQHMRGTFDTTLYDKVCQWLAAGRCFFPGSPVSSTNKTDRHDITEILLKLALNTINQLNHTDFTTDASCGTGETHHFEAVMVYLLHQSIHSSSA